MRVFFSFSKFLNSTSQSLYITYTVQLRLNLPDVLLFLPDPLFPLILDALVQRLYIAVQYLQSRIRLLLEFLLLLVLLFFQNYDLLLVSALEFHQHLTPFHSLLHYVFPRLFNLVVNFIELRLQCLLRLLPRLLHLLVILSQRVDLPIHIRQVRTLPDLELVVCKRRSRLHFFIYNSHKMDNFVVAMSRYKRRRYDDAIKLCDDMLSNNPRD